MRIYSSLSIGIKCCQKAFSETCSLIYSTTLIDFSFDKSIYYVILFFLIGNILCHTEHTIC